ncbi:MAG: hypothetical protein U5J83_08335 [Bryobacterales bacterium]|nr:hypothetical protein [Bryobacterales bacterium]
MTATWPLFRGGSARWWALGLASLVLSIAVLRPGLLAPLNAAFQWLVRMAGTVLQTAITFLLYAFLILPTGLSMRGELRQRLGFRFDAAASSYWIRRDADAPTSEMRQQF